MATTLANAPDLPSEDEEDQDYVPGAVEDDAKTSGKRKRAAGSVADVIAQAQASKQSKRVDDIWSQLKQQAGGTSASRAAVTVSSASAAKPQQHSLGTASAGRKVGGPINLGAVCRPVPKPQKAAADQAWRLQFGIGPSKSSEPAKQTSAEGKSIAAAAIEAAKALAASGEHGKVSVTETRRFAGQNIQIQKSVSAGSEAKAAAAIPAKSGLDAMLEAIRGAKKVTVLDKSKSDWDEQRRKDTELKADLQEHGRSSKRYVDQQDFLKRTELREYERERDQRLNADVRNRSRT